MPAFPGRKFGPPAPPAPIPTPATAADATAQATVPAAPAAPDNDDALALVETLRRLTAGSLDRAAVEAIIDQRLAQADPARVVHELHLPTGSIELPPGQHPQATALAKLLALGEHVLLTGPAGSGKTTAAEVIAEAMGRPLFVQGPVADSFQLTGFMSAGGSFVETQFSRWAETTGAILLLDEVDASRPDATFPLNPALANRRAPLAKGEVIVHESNLVIATANTWGTGATTEYVGRNKLDAAFLSRFTAKLDWSYDEAFESRICIAKAGAGADRFAKFVQSVRANAQRLGVKVIVTPRDTIAYARRRAAGFTHAEAVATGFLAPLTQQVRDSLTAGVEVVS